MSTARFSILNCYAVEFQYLVCGNQKGEIHIWEINNGSLPSIKRFVLGFCAQSIMDSIEQNLIILLGRFFSS